MSHPQSNQYVNTFTLSHIEPIDRFITKKTMILAELRFLSLGEIRKVSFNIASLLSRHPSRHAFDQGTVSWLLWGIEHKYQ
jgi:hypothetical protein